MTKYSPDVAKVAKSFGKMYLGGTAKGLFNGTARIMQTFFKECDTNRPPTYSESIGVGTGIIHYTALGAGVIGFLASKAYEAFGGDPFMSESMQTSYLEYVVGIIATNLAFGGAEYVWNKGKTFLECKKEKNRDAHERHMEEHVRDTLDGLEGVVSSFTVEEEIPEVFKQKKPYKDKGYRDD